MLWDLSGDRGREVDGFRVVSDGSIVFNRAERVIRLTRQVLLPEDVIAFAFAGVLEESGVKYVVVAGYTAILFGRGRRSDDIDFIIEEIDEDVFVGICRRAWKAGFTLMQGDIGVEESVRRVYRSYLAEGYSVRFMYRDTVLPNVEIKLARTEAHRYALDNSIKVVINNESAIRISPLELQIAYKLFLGTEKDAGDAVFLYTLFRDFIYGEELEKWCAKLKANCRVLEGV
ncbi:MAG: hypothetical protein QW348_08925 [Ignisphaera sp.]